MGGLEQDAALTAAPRKVQRGRCWGLDSLEGGTEEGQGSRSRSRAFASSDPGPKLPRPGLHEDLTGSTLGPEGTLVLIPQITKHPKLPDSVPRSL